MTDHVIESTTATGEEINAIVSLIEDAIVGQPRAKVLISLISLTLVVMNPEISPEELAQCVTDVSQFICLRLEGTGKQEGEEAPKVLLN